MASIATVAPNGTAWSTARKRRSCAAALPNGAATTASATIALYDIGDSWEINATVNVKGFVVKEVGDQSSASISFSVDMIGPDSIEVKNIFSDSKDITSDELIDIQLEAQFELDYSSPDGLYKLSFNITDNYSEETTSALAEFELKK